jgi:anion-transporting  ArsA/GET3 family ATPase
VKNLIESHRVILCVGSGGVGKTSVSAALAVAAAQSGKKVAVLTIDPSQRLAQTFGIAKGQGLTLVPGQNYSGKIYAATLDHTKVFDDFVKRSVKSPELAEKIMKNKLYQRMATDLSGSQEFTSLETLYTTHASGEFDLVILDTPPTKHAVDFLRSPALLARVFNDKIARWFRNPQSQNARLFDKIFYAGTKQVLKVLELLTGSDFVSELADFFSNIESWQQKIRGRVLDVQKMLESNETAFVMVSVFDRCKLIEANYLAQEITKSGFHFKAIVFNRVFPTWLVQTHNAQDPLFQNMKTYYSEREQIFEQSLQTKSFADAEKIKIPDLFDEVASLQNLEEICKYL